MNALLLAVLLLVIIWRLGDIASGFDGIQRRLDLSGRGLAARAAAQGRHRAAEPEKRPRGAAKRQAWTRRRARAKAVLGLLLLYAIANLAWLLVKRLQAAG